MSKYNTLPKSDQRTAEEQAELLRGFKRDEEVRYESYIDENQSQEALDAALKRSETAAAEAELEAKYQIEQRIFGDKNLRFMYTIAGSIEDLRDKPVESQDEADSYRIADKEARLAELMEKYNTAEDVDNEAAQMILERAGMFTAPEAEPAPVEVSKFARETDEKRSFRTLESFAENYADKIVKKGKRNSTDDARLEALIGEYRDEEGANPKKVEDMLQATIGYAVDMVSAPKQEWAQPPESDQPAAEEPVDDGASEQADADEAQVEASGTEEPEGSEEQEPTPLDSELPTDDVDSEPEAADNALENSDEPDAGVTPEDDAPVLSMETQEAAKPTASQSFNIEVAKIWIKKAYKKVAKFMSRLFAKQSIVPKKTKE